MQRRNLEPSVVELKQRLDGSGWLVELEVIRMLTGRYLKFKPGLIALLLQWPTQSLVLLGIH